MKCLPFITATISVLLLVFVMILVGCNGNNTQSNVRGTNDMGVIDDTIETEAIESENAVIQSVLEYRGDSILTCEDIILYANYGIIDNSLGDDVATKDETFIVRYVNDEPQDSAVLIGPYNRLIGNGKICKIVVGVDTLNIDIRKSLSGRLDLRYLGILPNCKFYRLSKHYALNDSARSTDFQINVAMPEDTPLHIKDFISGTIQKDVVLCFTDDDGGATITPHIPVFKMMDRSITEMSQYYYKQFCKLYYNKFGDFSDPEVPMLGEWCSYQFYAYPVWENMDKSLTTWKFYSFSYMDGAHGNTIEYYLTFDNKKGRVLGIRDFYSDETFNDAIRLLTRKLNLHQGKEPDGERKERAELDDCQNVTTPPSNLLNDFFAGKVYPRPAITQHGIVFSYQTYEKGSNADGVLHFLLPYNKNILDKTIGI